MGELFASALFAFMLFAFNFIFQVFQKQNENKPSSYKIFGLPFLYSFAATSCIIMGMTLGSLISGDGRGLGLLNPAFALIQMIYFNAFQGFFYIIGFQFLGAFLGVFAFVVFVLMSFLPTPAYQTGIMLNLLAMTAMIIILLVFASFFDFFTLSINIAFASVVVYCFTKATIAEKKQQILKWLMVAAIQTSWVLALSYGAYGLVQLKGTY